MRGISAVHLAFIGLLILFALSQVAFREKWDALWVSIDASRWQSTAAMQKDLESVPPSQRSPSERLRSYKKD